MIAGMIINSADSATKAYSFLILHWTMQQFLVNFDTVYNNCIFSWLVVRHSKRLRTQYCVSVLYAGRGVSMLEVGCGFMCRVPFRYLSALITEFLFREEDLVVHLQCAAVFQQLLCTTHIGFDHTLLCLASSRALLRSQCGPLASAGLTTLPISRATRLDPQPFRTWFLPLIVLSHLPM